MADKYEISILLNVILVTWNIIYFASKSESVPNLSLGYLISIVTTAVAIVIISGISILGTGMSGESARMLLGVVTYFSVCFQVNLAGFPVGLGLMVNLFDAMGDNAFGLTVVLIFVMTTFLSGLMVILGE